MAPKRRPEPVGAAPPPEKKKCAPTAPRRVRLWAAARTVLVVLFLTRGKDSGGADSLARIGRVLRAMWGKLERMEQRIQSLAHVVDGIARSCTTPRNQQRHTQEAEQVGTNAEAEMLATASTRQEERNTGIRLRFLNGIKSRIFQDDEIRSDSNAAIKIGIFDGENMIKSGSLSKVKIEILALEGNFPFDVSGSWTAKDFSKHRASGRDGNGSVLAGEGTTVRLINGECDLSGIRFREGSCRARNRKFIIGARVCDGEATGIRVQEAIMKPVDVLDRRNKPNEKRHPPLPTDRVHRLKEISKGGKYYKRLEKEKIRTVEDVVKALNKSPDNLAKILRINKEHKAWEKMVKHARQCCLKGKHELKSYPCKERNVVLYFNCMHDLVGAEFGDNHAYVTHDKFDPVQKVLVDELKGSAYDHLDALRSDHVMTETDIFPRPLNMDTGAGSGAGPSYISVGGPPAVEDPRQAQSANNDPGPSSPVPDHHGRDNHQDQWTQLAAQQFNSSVGIIGNFLFGYDAIDPQEYSTDSGPICVEPWLDQMEIPGQSFLQVNDTFEASTSTNVNMELVPLPQQLALIVAPGSAQGGMQNQMQAPLPNNVLSEASASPQQALPPQQWPQCQGGMPWPLARITLMIDMVSRARIGPRR